MSICTVGTVHVQINGQQVHVLIFQHCPAVSSAVTCLCKENHSSHEGKYKILKYKTYLIKIKLISFISAKTSFQALDVHLCVKWYDTAQEDTNRKLTNIKVA